MSVAGFIVVAFMLTMYVLLDGEMEVSKRSRRGRDTRVAILGPNDLFGEMSMIDMQSRSATVRALAPSRPPSPS